MGPVTPARTLQAICLVIAVCLLAIPALAQYGGGSGTADDPYQIATAEHLSALGAEPNDWGSHFRLTTDIDLEGYLYDVALIAYDVDPCDMSFNGASFTGVFDGNGHAIWHLTITGDSYLGLFGRSEYAAEIKNLRVLDANIAGSSIYAGGLVGFSRGSIAACCCTGAVSGDRFVGGLTGRNWGSITASYNAATVAGSNNVGGITADNYGSITDSYNTGAVAANWDAGGLVGVNSGSISTSYSTGTVSGDNRAGGLVGRNSPDYGVVTSSFWDAETCGLSAGDGGTAATTAEMQTAATFLDAGWDFTNIWTIWDGYDYPHLQWESGLKPPPVFTDVPGGTFEMGDHYDVGEADEKPVHVVTLDSFRLSKYETTNAQYAAYLNGAMADGLIHIIDGTVYAVSDANLAEPYFCTHAAISSSQIEYTDGVFDVRSRDNHSMADYPVVDVTWYGAEAFCDYHGYRLPTEAEWEYAARGGYHDPYYQYAWGSNKIDCSMANSRGGGDTDGFCNPLSLTSYPFLSPVGYYGNQGAYGLADMCGNVSEWCHDWYTSSYYSSSDPENPTGPDLSIVANRVLRGGSWSDYADRCRVASRHAIVPGTNRWDVGFRPCISSRPHEQ